MVINRQALNGVRKGTPLGRGDDGGISLYREIDSLAAFSALMREKLDIGSIHARKAYLRAVVSRIEVGDENIRIIGEKTALERAVTTTLAGGSPVSGLVRKWCARQDSNLRPQD